MGLKEVVSFYLETGATMNPAQIHLGLNHLPLALILVGVFILAAGIFRKSKELKSTGALLFLAAGLFTIPVYKSGEPTEKLVESKAGVTKAAIHEHELAAPFALYWSLALGLYALVLLVLEKRKNTPYKKAWVGLLVFGIFTLTVFLRVATLGGHIRHDELEAPTSTPS